MNALLKVTVSLSLSGTLLILVLLAVKPLYKNRVSKQWQYYIWLVVIARLLLPFAPETNLMGTLFQEREQVIVQAAVPFPEHHSTIPLPSAVEKSEEFTQKESLTAENMVQYLWMVWLGIALILLIRKITIYQSFEKYVRAGQEEIADIVLLDGLAQIGEQIGVTRPVELYRNRLISSPLLLGLLHPRVILPTAELPEADFQYTIQHELTHCKRWDILYKWLVQLTVCVHWFNPLVWLMGREIERACELSCDEAVIRDLDGQGRRAYGDTLLHATGGSYRSTSASVTLSESGELLKERLEAIMNFKRKSITVLSVFLAALLLMGAAAAGAASPVSGKTTLKMPENLTNSNTNGAMETLEFRGTTYYLVFTEAQLRAIGTGAYGLDKNYMQQADIDLSSAEWIPIGTEEHPFTGSYNGNGFEIRGLTMTDPNAKIIGMFGVAENADIYNITLRDYDIQTAGKNVSGRSIAPILAQGRQSFRYYDNYAYPKKGISTGNRVVPADSAETYYKNGQLPQFGTAFAALDQDARKAFLEKIVDDGQIAFFSVALQQLDADSPLFAALAEKVYADGNIAFFSVLCGHMSQEALASWQARAAADRRVNFQSVIFSESGQEREKEKLEAELDQEIAAAYESVGVTKNGKNYYYQGQLVHIFLDHRPNTSYYTLDMNPKGTVNVKILRDSSDRITGAAYMTEAEAAELFGKIADDEDDTEDDDWSWDWDEEDSAKEELDRQTVSAYETAGVTKNGGNYYYQGQLVNVFLDIRANQSFCTLDMNPKGTVNVKILRDSSDRITGAAYMTEAEAKKLLGNINDDEDQEEETVWTGATDIPITIASVKSGETVWLGTYIFAEGDQVFYNVTVETGERLDIGFARSGSVRTNKRPSPAYNMVSNSRENGKLEIKTGAITWKDPVKPGEYTLFLHTGSGDLSNVEGHVVIVKAN